MPPVRPRPQAQKPKSEKNPAGSGNTTTIVVIIILLLLIGGGIAAYFLYPPFQNFFRKTPKETIVTEPAPKDTVVIEEAPPIEELKPQKQESSNSAPKGFYIIVGSYRNQSYANKMVKNCSKDIELEVIYFEEIGMYRVSAGHYDNIHKAYNDAYSIKDLDGCANAWVLEIL